MDMDTNNLSWKVGSTDSIFHGQKEYIREEKETKEMKVIKSTHSVSSLC